MVLLLAVRPQKGGLRGGASAFLDLVLAGAAFLELEQAGSVAIRDGRIVVLQNNSGDPLHAMILEKLAARNEPRKVGFWLNNLRLSLRKIKAEVLRSLEDRKEIRLEEKRFLFFRWKKSYLLPGNHTPHIVDKVKRSVSQPLRSKEEHALLTLLEVGELLPRVYPDRYSRKVARAKIRKFRSDPDFGRDTAAMEEVVKAIRQAIAGRRAAARS